MEGRKPIWLREDLHGTLKAMAEKAGRHLIDVADEVVTTGLWGDKAGFMVTKSEAKLILALLVINRRQGDTSTLVNTSTAQGLERRLRDKVKR